MRGKGSGTLQALADLTVQHLGLSIWLQVVIQPPILVYPCRWLRLLMIANTPVESATPARNSSKSARPFPSHGGAWCLGTQTTCGVTPFLSVYHNRVWNERVYLCTTLRSENSLSSFWLDTLRVKGWLEHLVKILVSCFLILKFYTENLLFHSADTTERCHWFGNELSSKDTIHWGCLWHKLQLLTFGMFTQLSND